MRNQAEVEMGRSDPYPAVAAFLNTQLWAVSKLCWLWCLNIVFLLRISSKVGAKMTKIQALGSAVTLPPISTSSSIQDLPHLIHVNSFNVEHRVRMRDRHPMNALWWNINHAMARGCFSLSKRPNSHDYCRAGGRVHLININYYYYYYYSTSPRICPCDMWNTVYIHIHTHAF